MRYFADSTKEPEREEWHLHLHDGSGKPEGRFYLCSALTQTEANIMQAVCDVTEAHNAEEAYRKMIAKLDARGFESARSNS